MEPIPSSSSVVAEYGHFLKLVLCLCIPTAFFESTFDPLSTSDLARFKYNPDPGAPAKQNWFKEPGVANHVDKGH